jgi:hypothetical protein
MVSASKMNCLQFGCLCLCHSSVKIKLELLTEVHMLRTLSMCFFGSAVVFHLYPWLPDQEWIVLVHCEAEVWLNHANVPHGKEAEGCLHYVVQV